MSSLLKTILVLVLFVPSFAQAQPVVGKPFPDLARYELSGTLPDLAGKVVLVDFWASWCAPCKASFPFYSSLQKELAPRGFVILAVSVDTADKPFVDFVKRLAPSFATVRDASQKLVADLKPPGMPTCYLIDRQGVLRLVHSGFHGAADERTLREAVAKLLDAKTP